MDDGVPNYIKILDVKVIYYVQEEKFLRLTTLDIMDRNRLMRFSDIIIAENKIIKNRFDLDFLLEHVLVVVKTIIIEHS